LMYTDLPGMLPGVGLTSNAERLHSLVNPQSLPTRPRLTIVRAADIARCTPSPRWA